MTLSFPNPSRSFDEMSKSVRFVGYDDLFEVSFFLEASALSKPVNGEFSQSACLVEFDAKRDIIHDAARRVYSRKRGTPYTLKKSDF